MSDFDIAQQPSPVGVGKPGSGTYGEGAALDRLKEQLPSPAAPGAGPMPQGPGGMPMPAPGAGPAPKPAGLPAAIMAPTARPDVPIQSPLDPVAPVNPVQAAQTSRQRNMAALDALVNDPAVSAVTREWAAGMIQLLVKESTR